MFFICGVHTGQKLLSDHQLVICEHCGGYGRYQVYMTYLCLSLFFIPIFKWGRRYYVKMSCCETVYKLDPKIAREMERGAQTEISPADLTMAQPGRRSQWQPRSARKLICRSCGYETEEDFVYCPKCGGKFES